MVSTFMGSPLRHIQPHRMSNSNAPISTSTPSDSQTQGLGMTPASRYDHNLKVMRRRYPSVQSIIDQFSHVCVYQFHKTWDKHCEGTMFLVERNEYPPYGFYIMNRAGSNDYFQELCPEDEVLPTEKILIIRSYPDFLKARLRNLKSPDKFSNMYALPNADSIDSESKGSRIIIGLWTHEDYSRESLPDVMQRLHSYIKKNEPYPEKFRYGPGRPPPPNRLRAIPKRTGGSTSDSQTQRFQSDSENERSYYSDFPTSTNRGGLSDIERLFSKLTPASSPHAGNFITQSNPPKPVSSTTGIALLDSIFASAVPPPTPKAISDTSTINRQNPSVFAPQPSIGTPGPQILNSQVLDSMLNGSAPSRASSVVSHPSSREGDNEGSGNGSPSTVLDDDSDCRDYHSVSKNPRISVDHRHTGTGNAVRLNQKVKGDVTPRLPLNGLQRTSSFAETPSSTSVIRPTSQATPPAPFSVRDASYAPNKLPSFQSDSDVWPSSSGNTDDDSGSDIVELNFEDTSILSRPDFANVVSMRQANAVANGVVRPVNGIGSSPVSSEKVKGKNRRRLKKDKEDPRKSQDPLPSSLVTATRGVGAEKVSENLQPPTSHPLLSKKASATMLKTPTLSGTLPLSVNGTSSPAKLKGKMPNGHSNAEGLNGQVEVAGPVDAKAVRLSMTRALFGQNQLGSSVGKAEFVNQVLSLLQTDQNFSDQLYNDYITHV